MKRILLVLAVLVITGGIFVHYNNSPEVIVTNLMKKCNIGPGDLVYEIYLFGFIPAGKAVIKKEIAAVYNGREVYRLSAVASSAAYFSKIFNATAELDSYIDKNTFNPFFFSQKTIISGKGAVKKEIVYDQDTGVMTIADVRRQILPDTQDPLSAVYNLRLIDFDKIRKFKINLNTNQKNYLMEGRVEIKGVKAGNEITKLAVATAKIRRGDGNPHHKSELSVFMLADKGNIPILIKISASGAVIYVKLAGIE